MILQCQAEPVTVFYHAARSGLCSHNLSFCVRIYGKPFCAPVIFPAPGGLPKNIPITKYPAKYIELRTIPCPAMHFVRRNGLQTEKIIRSQPSDIQKPAFCLCLFSQILPHRQPVRITCHHHRGQHCCRDGS